MSNVKILESISEDISLDTIDEYGGKEFILKFYQNKNKILHKKINYNKKELKKPTKFINDIQYNCVFQNILYFINDEYYEYLIQQFSNIFTYSNNYTEESYKLYVNKSKILKKEIDYLELLSNPEFSKLYPCIPPEFYILLHFIRLHSCHIEIIETMDTFHFINNYYTSELYINDDLYMIKKCNLIPLLKNKKHLLIYEQNYQNNEMLNKKYDDENFESLINEYNTQNKNNYMILINVQNKEFISEQIYDFLTSKKEEIILNISELNSSESISTSFDQSYKRQLSIFETSILDLKEKHILMYKDLDKLKENFEDKIDELDLTEDYQNNYLSQEYDIRDYKCLMCPMNNINLTDQDVVKIGDCSKCIELRSIQKEYDILINDIKNIEKKIETKKYYYFKGSFINCLNIFMNSQLL